jgi:hypothetical protein
MPEGALSAAQWLKGDSQPKPADFYRSAVRVGILGILAEPAYFFWWLWQLFQLTRREGFPRARAFWWILVPFYSWVVIYRQFDDLDTAARNLGRPGLASKIPVTLLVLSNVAAIGSNRLQNGVASLIAVMVSGAFFGAAAYLVQRTANDYLKTKYPDPVPRGLTWGEITAAAIGLLISGLAIVGAFLPES